MFIHIFKCDRGLEAIGEIKKLNFGKIHERIRTNVKRVFWGFAWDHYIGGETEVHIMFPSIASEIPNSIDMFNIDAMKWDSFLSDLSKKGDLQIGKEHFPEKICDFFSKEGDFLNGFIFEGSYKNLVLTLSFYEKRLNLIPGLNRHDTPLFIMDSTVLAFISLAVGAREKPSYEKFLQDGANLAIKKFGVPDGLPYFKQISEEISSLIEMIDYDLWEFLSGPTWVDAKQFQELACSARAISTNNSILIDENGIVSILIK